MSHNLQTLWSHSQPCKLQQSIACSVSDTISQVLQTQFCLSSKTKRDHTTHPQQGCVPTAAREVYDLSQSPWFCNAYSTQGDQLRVIKSDFHVVHFPQGMSEQQHCLIQPKQYSISIKDSLPCFSCRHCMATLKPLLQLAPLQAAVTTYCSSTAVWGSIQPYIKQLLSPRK